MKNKSNNDLGTISSMVKVRDSPLITFILTEKLNPGAKRRYENQVMLYNKNPNIWESALCYIFFQFDTIEFSDAKISAEKR